MQCDDLYNIKSTCKRTKVSAVSQNMNIESKSCQVLTIETVRQKDFGTYACVVRNSLGEVVLIYIFTYFLSISKEVQSLTLRNIISVSYFYKPALFQRFGGLFSSKK